jgi:uncharacterized protein (DUF1499 family)
MKTNARRIIVMMFGLLAIAGCSGERPDNPQNRERFIAPCSILPHCVSSQDKDVLHRIAPLAFNGDPDAAFARLKLVLSQRADTTIREDLPGYLRVELHTTLFVDDGEFLLDRTHKVIQVRSASRLGISDFGKNRRRLEDIRRQLLAQEKKDSLKE